MKKRTSPKGRRLGTLLAGASTLPLGTAGGWIAYSALFIDHAFPASKAIDAEWRTFLGQHSGLLTYYMDRHAAGRRPLVLLHSINAAGSSYEMLPLFEHYKHTRPVFALDLPGFGVSERSDRRYSPRLYRDAILDLLEAEIGEAADVVALSLSSEFAALAAVERPELFHSLVLISPTGFTARHRNRASQQASADQTSGGVYRLFAFPLWAQAFYDLIATRRSIHYFLAQSFEAEVDRGLEDYAYITSHQPGARHAPLYFVSGGLFTRDVRREVYDRITLPVLVLYDQDAFTRFDTLPDHLQKHPSWQTVQIVPTRGLPQFEKPAATAQTLDEFWKETG